MDNIKRLLDLAVSQSNQASSNHNSCLAVVAAAYEKLCLEARYGFYGYFAGSPQVAYNVFSGDRIVSRPIRSDIFILGLREFVKHYNYLIRLLGSGPSGWSEREITIANRTVYSAVMSVACCYDIWLPGSRKTPGTFFEILMASLVKHMLPDAVFSKHVPLAALFHSPQLIEQATANAEADLEAENTEDGRSSVATDLVIGIPQRRGGVVVPLKITTRERIVQPFAHQRILDAASGPGTYKSLLVCMSETQLDKKSRSVKQVCVPGTVKLFQLYLSSLSGLYYCDIPQRYAAEDMKRIIPVRSVGNFFEDLKDLLDTHRVSAN